MRAISRYIARFTIFLLGTILFVFLHSELGILDAEGDTHGQHDYCLIFKDSVNLHKSVKNECGKVPPSPLASLERPQSPFSVLREVKGLAEFQKVNPPNLWLQNLSILI